MSQKYPISVTDFENLEMNLHHFKEVTSTMTIARKLAMEGCPDMTVVLADIQTKGRGRMKRIWQSEAGGLYFTVIVRTVLPPNECSLLNFLASVILTRVIQQQCDLKVSVKWPNDILFGTRKLAGMLSELVTPPHQKSAVNIGIGLNVNNTPSQMEPTAISLKEILGHPVSRKMLLKAFIHEFEKQLDPFDTHRILSEWKTHTATLHNRVRIETLHGTYEGIAVDIDPHGALILKLKDGSLKTVSHGDCFITDPIPS